jgi:hypothetical protein
LCPVGAGPLAGALLEDAEDLVLERAVDDPGVLSRIDRSLVNDLADKHGPGPTLGEAG